MESLETSGTSGELGNSCEEPQVGKVCEIDEIPFEFEDVHVPEFSEELKACEIYEITCEFEDVHIRKSERARPGSFIDFCETAPESIEMCAFLPICGASVSMESLSELSRIVC